MTSLLERRRAKAGPRPTRRVSPENALGWFILAVLFVLVGAPLVLVLAQGVAPGLGLARDWTVRPGLLGEIARRPLWQTSLVNSLTLATGAMLLGGALGTGLALLRHTVAFPGARLLDVAAWALLVSPSFVLAQGWVLFASPSGVAVGTLGVDPSSLVFSPTGLVVITSLIKYPFAYLATSAALHWDDGSYRQAAALAGARPWTVLRTVRIPLLTPAVASGAILVFVDVLGDFGLPAALSAAYSYPTLPYSIYASVRQSPVSFELGGVLSFYLVAIIGAAILLYIRILRGSRYDFLTGAATRVPPPPARYPWLWSGLTALVLAITFGVPLGTSLQVSFSRTLHGGPVPDNLTLEHYADIFSAGSRMSEGIVNSLTIALAAATVTTVLAFLIGVVLTFTGFRARFLIDVAGTVTLAIPGIVLAVGYIFLWNQPFLAGVGLGLYGRAELLVLAGTATALPIAVRLQLGALAQVPASLLNAAALSGARFPTRLRTVLAPLIAPALVSAFAAVLASGIFDLAATTMLAPPSFTTLPVEILAEYDRGRYGYATAGAVVSAVLVMVLAAVSSVIGRRLLGGPTHGSGA
ncbi:ABC transporter permease [Nocardiopsis lambiniae]|uniref:Iron ABC transporter permease n=1 Tax=Nocardiopsis lambiniae TaxID=3075539 RepID=A0ABU2M5E3_9ACTN|nr:iron ABC transporter permease [Nocardiopsis sp. DSM 44743]MDT0327551.1 iron ABC transporter permease [Nocardiopsis sp. DSM 44743]